MFMEWGVSAKQTANNPDWIVAQRRDSLPVELKRFAHAALCVSVCEIRRDEDIILPWSERLQVVSIQACARRDRNAGGRFLGHGGLSHLQSKTCFG
jgi:hypothetical protein